MRNPTLLPTVLLGILASSSYSIPVRATLADGGPGGTGAITFAYDMQRQASPPFDFPDVNEFSGDYIRKQEDYRINIADFFHVEMEDWTGYGFNWLLERYPRDGGIFEQYAQIIFFSALGGTLVLEGAWTDFWSVGTPISAILQTDAGEIRSSTFIASLGDPANQAIPEPGTMALYTIGLGALVGMGLLRRRLQA